MYAINPHPGTEPHSLLLVHFLAASTLLKIQVPKIPKSNFVDKKKATASGRVGVFRYCMEEKEREAERERKGSYPARIVWIPATPTSPNLASKQPFFFSLWPRATSRLSFFSFHPKPCFCPSTLKGPCTHTRTMSRDDEYDYLFKGKTQSRR